MGDESSTFFSDNSNFRNMDVVSKPVLPELVGLIKNDMHAISGQAIPSPKPKEVKKFLKLLQMRQYLILRKVRVPSKEIVSGEKTTDTSAFVLNISQETTKTQHGKFIFSQEFSCNLEENLKEKK